MGMSSLHLDKTKMGTLGWVALAAGVITWDLCAEETLTGAFRRSHDSPVARVVVMAAWGVLTGHLFSIIPARLDPLDFTHYTVIARHTSKGRRTVELLEEEFRP